ncbi:F-box and associated interaction domains-containing protein [Rhynchospora pubera]|uniref:F-box and associated interaction domains-containing protein n=1 Tax=Rhynchospora pubera TaxID=906938 RepID=A0AAV8G2K1_9POAL|nr:F-box and associated interaction domains-containing protein [Rhynchospora pubera]
MAPVSVRRSERLKGKAQSAVTLPDDVVIEILSWLPPKPFFRFKCVSKSWCALSSVAYYHNKHFQPTAHGLFYHTNERREVNNFYYYAIHISFVNFPAEADKVSNTFRVSLDNFKLRVVDCCNGLLLVEGRDFDSPHATEMYVYNPAIQNILTVWSLPPKRLPRFYEVFSLAFEFDPCVQSQIHVVCFMGWCKQEVEYNSFSIFSFKTGKWKSAKKLGHGVRIIKSAKGIFVNGMVHRLTTRKEILSIDPTRGSYQRIQPPHSHPASRLNIEQCQGLLNFLTLDNNFELSIWVLESIDSQEWVLKHRLSGKIFDHNFVMHPWKNILFVAPVATDHNRLISVDLNTGKEEKLCLLSPTADMSDYIWVYMPYYK